MAILHNYLDMMVFRKPVFFLETVKYGIKRMFFIDLIVLFILLKLVFRIDKRTQKSNPGF